MDFPNAKKGIKQLFTAEILSLINVIGSVITLILGAVTERLTGSETGTVGVVMMIALLASVAASAVLTVVAMILNIVGTVQAAKDERSFKVVIYVVVFGLAVTVGSSIFSVVAGAENQALSNISQMVSDIVNTVTTALITIGICNIATRINDMKVFNKGQTLFKIIMTIAVLSLFARGLATFVPNSATVVIEIVLFIVSGVLSLVQYFAFLSFLRKASKMLGNK